ncbi:MAG: hypothetical protein O0X49_04445, partial [Methanocorpusculum sp.]|nr:hypothetical protein [Methanocorpusculum sp.]
TTICLSLILTPVMAAVCESTFGSGGHESPAPNGDMVFCSNVSTGELQPQQYAFVVPLAKYVIDGVAYYVGFQVLAEMCQALNVPFDPFNEYSKFVQCLEKLTVHQSPDLDLVWNSKNYEISTSKNVTRILTAAKQDFGTNYNHYSAADKEKIRYYYKAYLVRDPVSKKMVILVNPLFPITRSEAVDRFMKGQNVFTVQNVLAKDVASAASDSKYSIPRFHSNITHSECGYYPHYHPMKHGKQTHAHIWYI